MNTIISFVKRTPLLRTLMVCLAGIVLLFSTACSNRPFTNNPPQAIRPSDSRPSDATVPPRYDTPQQYNTSGENTKDNVVLKAVKESYEVVPPVGGMNMNRDTDRRQQNTDFAEARGKALADHAQERVQNRPSNLKEVGSVLRNEPPTEKIKDKAQDISQNVKESFSNTTEDTIKGAERGFENLKGNVKAGTDAISENVRDYVQ